MPRGFFAFVSCPIFLFLVSPPTESSLLGDRIILFFFCLGTNANGMVPTLFCYGDSSKSSIPSSFAFYFSLSVKLRNLMSSGQLFIPIAFYFVKLDIPRGVADFAWHGRPLLFISAWFFTEFWLAKRRNGLPLKYPLLDEQMFHWNSEGDGRTFLGGDGCTTGRGLQMFKLLELKLVQAQHRSHPFRDTGYFPKVHHCGRAL